MNPEAAPYFPRSNASRSTGGSTTAPSKRRYSKMELLRVKEHLCLWKQAKHTSSPHPADFLGPSTVHIASALSAKRGGEPCEPAAKHSVAPTSFEFIDYNKVDWSTAMTFLMFGPTQSAIWNPLVQVPPATFVPPPSVMVAPLLQSCCARERTLFNGFLAQPGDVVEAELTVQMVFFRPSTSHRLHAAAKASHAVVSTVRAFLMGESAAASVVLPPDPSDDALWESMLAHLRFDWIRDNRTRLYTELSKQWKKRHTPFEQFAHFFGYRKDTPYYPTKGMLTHSQKPVIVACIAGDLQAVVALCELGFEVPSESIWNALPFFREALDPQRYTLFRAICSHYCRPTTTDPAFSGQAPL